MNIHKNARLTPLGRERMVKMVLNEHTLQSAACHAGVCSRTARKWLARYKAEGTDGLQDRSSRPKKLRKPGSVQNLSHIFSGDGSLG